MAAQMFMRVDEVAEMLGVSKPYAYKLIREMNEELKKTGCITIPGRIDRKFSVKSSTQPEIKTKGGNKNVNLHEQKVREVQDQRPLRKFCVSDIRQNQEYHIIHVHD